VHQVGNQPRLLYRVLWSY